MKSPNEDLLDWRAGVAWAVFMILLLVVVFLAQ